MRNLLGITISALPLALVGCGGGDTNDNAETTSPVVTPTPAPAVAPSNEVELDGNVTVYISNLAMSTYSQGEQNCLMRYTVENGLADQIVFAFERYAYVHADYSSTGAMMVPRPVTSGRSDSKELDLSGGFPCEGLQSVNIVQVKCEIYETGESCADQVVTGESVGGVSLTIGDSN